MIYLKTRIMKYQPRVGTAVRYEESTIELENEKNVDPAFDLGLEYSHLLKESLF